MMWAAVAASCIFAIVAIGWGIRVLSDLESAKDSLATLATLAELEAARASEIRTEEKRKALRQRLGMPDSEVVERVSPLMDEA